MRLSKSLLDLWYKEWAAPVEQLELENGAGKTYTKAEQLAAAQSSTRLTAEDPLPQTVFRIAIRAGKPLMVELPISIAK
jgi:hypothetical protein